MTFRMLILVSGALALASCGKHEDATNADLANGADNSAAVNSALAVQPTDAQGFLNAAGASDRFEIESSKLAAASASSAAVKSFAAKMVSAHTASTQKMKAAAAALTPPLTIDDTLSAEQQQALDTLKGKTGADFDSAYAAAQVDAHQKALDLLNGYSASGDTPALKDAAKGMIPTVTAHLNMAKGLK
jgi:putative membrane protein